MDLENRIAELNKQQYNNMLMGADSKVESLDMVIKNTQKQLDDLKAGKGAAMGIGSESADKDMLSLYMLFIIEGWSSGHPFYSTISFLWAGTGLSVSQSREVSSSGARPFRGR